MWVKRLPHHEVTWKRYLAQGNTLRCL
jgi:hypothetical protein